MPSSDEARAALFQASHGAFVAERKRLAAELRPHDKAGAAALAKQPRPPVPAWAVNQLWWKARAPFEALLQAAQRVRLGELTATGAHREALQTLLARAEALLKEDGNAAAAATLRKVEFTLAAVAMNGFAPDAPGMLTEERAPPGFDSLAGFALPPPSLPVPMTDDEAVKRAEEAARLAEVARREAEVRRIARERAELDLAAAQQALKRAEDEVARVEATLEVARSAVELARRRVEVATKKLGEQPSP